MENDYKSKKIDYLLYTQYIPELNLADELENMGFFSAPASTKFHGNYEGGLYEHSQAVTDELLSLTDRLGLKWQRDISPYVIGLFHDLCKCDQYKKNTSLECGWEYRKVQNLNGHGDKSVMRASTLLKLTEEEMFCIRYHMGAFSDDAEERSAYSRAIHLYENVLWTHTADMVASQVRGT